MKNTTNILKKISTLFLFLSIIGLYSGGYIGIYNDITNISIIVFSLSSLLSNYDKKYFISSFFISFLIFTVYSMVTILFSYNEGLSTEMVISLFKLMILLLGLSSYLTTKNNFMSLFKFLGFGGLFYGLIIIIIENPFSGIRTGSTLGDLNTFGIYLTFSFSYFIYEFLKNKKIFNLIFCMIVLFFILITGSRTAFISIIIFLFVLFVQMREISIQKRLKKFAVFITSMFILIYLIFNNALLYSVLGIRIERALFTAFGIGDSVIEGSTSHRIGFIKYGYQLFVNKPLFGYGINTFRSIIYDNKNFYAASHNNYIDLLVGVGIFGFIVYYFIHFKIIYILTAKNRKSRDLLKYVLIAMLASLMVSDFFLVKYYLKLEIIIISMIYHGALIISNKSMRLIDNFIYNGVNYEI